MRLLTIAICAAAAVWFGEPSSVTARARFRCDPIPDTAKLQTALNAFWGRSVRLCGNGRSLARALPDANMVLADPGGLASIAEDYGPSAAMGILAHEWGHIVQGDDWGAGSELQADCLAGAFLRAYGIDRAELRPFEWLSLDSGDIRWRRDGHGTGEERRDAMLWGYMSVPVRGNDLLQACAEARSGPARRPRTERSYRKPRGMRDRREESATSRLSGRAPGYQTPTDWLALPRPMRSIIAAPMAILALAGTEC